MASVKEIYDLMKNKDFHNDLWFDLISDLKEKPSFKRIRKMVEDLVTHKVEDCMSSNTYGPAKRSKVIVELSIMAHTVDSIISQILYRNLKNEFHSIIKDIYEEIQNNKEPGICYSTVASEQRNVKESLLDDDHSNASDDFSDLSDVSSVKTSDISDFDDEISMVTGEGPTRIIEKIPLKIAIERYKRENIEEEATREANGNVSFVNNNSIPSRLTQRARKPNPKYAYDSTMSDVAVNSNNPNMLYLDCSSSHEDSNLSDVSSISEILKDNFKISNECVNPSNVKRKVGRPKKQRSIGDEEIAQSPKKETNLEFHVNNYSNSFPKRKAGRPKKQTQVPLTNETASNIKEEKPENIQKRKVGRPKKAQSQPGPSWVEGDSFPANIKKEEFLPAPYKKPKMTRPQLQRSSSQHYDMSDLYKPRHTVYSSLF